MDWRRENLKETTPEPKEVSNLATAELVFLFKSFPLVIAGIPNDLLPLCGPEVQSCYYCQVPQCGFDFTQKAAACNHVCCNNLTVALACLYCSFENNPHMRWYSATAWELTQPSIAIKMYPFILMTHNFSRSSNHDLAI